jgi:hypothetical protein
MATCVCCVQCAAGAKHSCAITSGHPPPSPHSGGQPLPPTTHCFCWGWNGHGQCGTSLSDARSSRPGDISQPWLVPQLEGVQLTAVAAGLAHTVVLSSDGAAYALGWNNRGQLGAGVACAGSSCPLLVEGSQLDHAHLVQVGQRMWGHGWRLGPSSVVWRDRAGGKNGVWMLCSKRWGLNCCRTEAGSRRVPKWGSSCHNAGTGLHVLPLWAPFRQALHSKQRRAQSPRVSPAALEAGGKAWWATTATTHPGAV